MELAKREDCTGCGACLEICPKKAIRYRDDHEGFPTPVIDSDKCVECGLCQKVCPVFNPPEKTGIKAAYAAQLSDDPETLKESTSGGVFTALAREILRRGGIVFGCVWNESYEAVIVSAENEEELKPMHGSKYVWSSTNGSFPKVKQVLEEGREVLFTSLPCQGAGLKNYLRKEYPNLCILVFFCGGAPSPLAFKEYLKTITKDVPSEKLDFKFRDKEKYGTGVHISYQGKKERIHQSYVGNPYFFSYHTKVFHRPCCYHCRYRYETRYEDLTMGDYWGLGEFHKEPDFHAGVSALLVNTPKGEEMLEAVRDHLELIPTKPEYIAKHNNLTLGNAVKTFNPPPFRDAFIEKMKKSGWKAAERRYLIVNKTRIKLTVKKKLPKKTQEQIRKLLGR